MVKDDKLALSKFHSKFATERDCKNHLIHVRWPHGFVCPKCGSTEYSFYKCKNGFFECKKCHKQTSITVGTVMQNTHLPIATWFWAIWLVSTDKRGISAVQLSRQLGICYESAWYLLKRIRTAMGKKDANYQLAGLVEMDTFYFGGRDEGNGHQGHAADKERVMIAVSRTDEAHPRPFYVKMQVFKQINAESVKDFANRWVEKGSTVDSDDAAELVSGLAGNYTHTHKKYVKPKKNEICLDADGKKPYQPLGWLHITVSNVKNLLRGTYHGNVRHDIQPYLDEFCYRYNRRNNPDEMFSRLLRDVTLA